LNVESISENDMFWSCARNSYSVMMMYEWTNYTTHSWLVLNVLYSETSLNVSSTISHTRGMHAW